MPDSRTDRRFTALVTEAADDRADQVLDGIEELTAPAVHHRTVMAAAKALIACRGHERSRHHGSIEAASGALRLIDHLASMQGADGLFDGENLASPPDTAFTINDLCDAYGLLEQSGESAAAAKRLERIAASAKESLLRGGVHTPNHRWELSAALARMHRHWPDQRLVERVDQWLAEGIDIAPDGMYSERSANYALHVSNPSLTAIGTALDRPELLDDVVRNLEAIAATTLPDGTVETVHSRRQDQRGTIDLAGFLMQFRRFAIRRDRGDFAGIVAEILTGPLADPTGALTEILLEPALAAPLPPPEPRKPVRRLFPSAGLAVAREDRFYACVYGGSDYAEHGRIRSGLATNPTFLRLAGGAAVLESARLTRDFFGLGPFRADGLTEEDGAYTLRERVSAAYYQPLGPEHRRADGRYALTDEGRFSAAMDFDHRPTTEVALDTELRIELGRHSARIECESDGRVSQAIELTFRPGGRLADDGRSYRHGGDAIEIDTSGSEPRPAGPGAYHPGEDYTHLSGTDAVDGPKVRIPLSPSGRTVVTLRHTERRERD
ncbi:hypothetical protein [Glycomyces salinus]|uniref:hypothetical protein n=1 Tax=Glycomyces salinus TaxID=980294 RepID=UPI0018EDA2ED|nr:hypothetical protein [Glycomyces salinus]